MNKPRRRPIISETCDVNYSDAYLQLWGRQTKMNHNVVGRERYRFLIVRSESRAHVSRIGHRSRCAAKMLAQKGHIWIPRQNFPALCLNSSLIDLPLGMKRVRYRRLDLSSGGSLCEVFLATGNEWYALHGNFFLFVSCIWFVSTLFLHLY